MNKTERTRFRYKSVRAKLFSLDNICKYCGVEMILPESVKLEGYKKLPDNMCTINHTLSRYGVLLNKDIKPSFEICCTLCNNHLQQVESDQLPREVLWKQSKKHNPKPNLVMS